MNVKKWDCSRAVQFLFWEYLFKILGIVSLQWGVGDCKLFLHIVGWGKGLGLMSKA
jgi:hypothetical protein